MIDKKRGGRYNELSVVQYEYNGQVMQAEVSYNVSDSRNENIPIAINKLTKKVVRMNMAFGFDEICMYIVLLGLFPTEYLLYRMDKQKLNIRKAKEMIKGSDYFKENGEIKIDDSTYKHAAEYKKRGYIKRIDAVVIKVKRVIEVDCDYIWIWCENIDLNGRKRKFKSGKVVETKKWKVGDIIIVLVNPDNERDYKILTED